MKHKKGISLMVLGITIVVMIILASTMVVSCQNMITDTLKQDFASEIYSLQKLVDSYYYLNQEYPILASIQIDLSEIDPIWWSQFEGEDIISQKIELYQIDLEKCDVEQLKRGVGKTSKDYYAVSQKTGKIYYIQGFQSENAIYYTLTPELKSVIGI